MAGTLQRQRRAPHYPMRVSIGSSAMSTDPERVNYLLPTTVSFSTRCGTKLKMPVCSQQWLGCPKWDWNLIRLRLGA